MPTEHEPWIGGEYDKGLNGQRIAIVGWSHWGDTESIEATNTCISNVISGEWRIRFFSSVRNYFSFDIQYAHSDFWPKVVFFNFIPDLVGKNDERFGDGTTDQRSRALDRFNRILKRVEPEKVFVFTARHRWFPNIENRKPFAEKLNNKFSMVSYSAGKKNCQAFFLRHPQGASRDVMKAAVHMALSRS